MDGTVPRLVLATMNGGERQLSRCSDSCSSVGSRSRRRASSVQTVSTKITPASTPTSIIPSRKVSQSSAVRSSAPMSSTISLIPAMIPTRKNGSATSCCWRTVTRTAASSSTKMKVSSRVSSASRVAGTTPSSNSVARLYAASPTRSPAAPTSTAPMTTYSAVSIHPEARSVLDTPASAMGNGLPGSVRFYSPLLAGELRVALLAERAHGFSGVFGTEVHHLGCGFRFGRLREGRRECLVEEVLRLCQRDGRHLEQPLDDGVHCVVELGGRHHAVHDADALGLAGVDHLGEERQLLGLVHTDEAGQEPRAAVVDAQSALHEDRAEAGEVGCDHEVAPEREAEPRAGRHAVHLCDGGLADVAQRGRAASDASHVAEASTRAAGHAGVDEIGAGAEALAGAGDDEHAVVAVGGDIDEDIAQVAPHLAGDGVELVGTVERERHHAVATLHEEV